MRALHFFALGGLLLALQSASRAFFTSTDRPTIVIGAARHAEIQRGLAEHSGRRPAPDAQRASVEHAVDDEIFYHEAVARGLDRDDPVVRDRVVQSMRLLADDPAADEAGLFRAGLDLGLDRSDLVVRRHLAATMRLLTAAPARLQRPSEAELAGILAAEADRFRLPATTSITHVFLSRGRDARGERAVRLRETLAAEGVDPAEAPVRGDPFSLGFHMAGRTDADLDAAFGAGFAAAVAALPVASWGGPIPSSYGFHIVWVERRTPARVPPVAAVRSRLVERAYQARGERRLHDWLAAQRARYEIRIEEPGDREAAVRAASMPLDALPLPRPAAIVGD